MPTSHTVECEPEVDHVIKTFTFEPDSVDRQAHLFNHHAVVKGEEERLEMIVQYQSLAGLSCFASKEDEDKARQHGLLPKSRKEAPKLLAVSLTPCLMIIPKPVATPPPPAPSKKRRPSTEGEQEMSRGEVRWRLRQQLLMRQLEEKDKELHVVRWNDMITVAQNDSNEAKEKEKEEELLLSSVVLPTDYAGSQPTTNWRYESEAEELLREMALPSRERETRLVECTDEELASLDLACYETLKSSDAGSTTENPVWIEDDDAMEDEGISGEIFNSEGDFITAKGRALYDETQAEEGLLQDAVWYELTPAEMERRARAAEEERKRLERRVKADHAAVWNARESVTRNAAKRGDWCWTMAVRAEDRLQELQRRLAERKREYAAAALKADSAKAVYELMRERYDYNPEEHRKAAGSMARRLKKRQMPQPMDN